MNLSDLASYFEQTATRMPAMPSSPQSDLGLLSIKHAPPAERSTSFDIYPLQLKQEESDSGSYNSTPLDTSIAALWTHLPPSYRSTEAFSSGSDSSYYPSQTVSSQSSSSTLPSTVPTSEPTPNAAETILDIWQPASAPCQPAHLQYTPGFPNSFTHMPSPSVKPVRTMEDRQSMQRDDEPLKKIEESIHCFWLVSENRMKQMQDELTGMATRLKASESEQNKISENMAQVMPLQVQMTEKAIQAVDERKLIFSRIKALEQSTETWQKEMNKTLQEMQSEFRAGIETMLELAPKGRKAPIPKPVAEAASTASTSAPASAPAAGAAKTNNKRASPQSKKPAANVKKSKLQSKDDTEGKDAAVPTVSTPADTALAKAEDANPALSARPQRLSVKPPRGPYDLMHSQPQLRSSTPNMHDYQRSYSSLVMAIRPQRGHAQA
ncbi:uncharacterized protein UBRO_08203 [Ustilago bromivora]|uniref:Uncharacterized protein n=1 Tax=Ustilago bromivora TaxID=307758 RepID=A0A1K0HKH9_9BASI|nr:uncharacterized protein UBRO_08203 [Ustilago bromivora]SYW76116.1 uncharacterized protein UBRO2_01187 [Ustilago bromivora]